MIGEEDDGIPRFCLVFVYPAVGGEIDGDRLERRADRPDERRSALTALADRKVSDGPQLCEGNDQCLIGVASSDRFRG